MVSMAQEPALEEMSLPPASAGDRLVLVGGTIFFTGEKMAKKKTSGKEMLVVGSKVRTFIKSKKCMTSSEFLPALSQAVAEMVARATERAKANKRSTLRARDL